MAYFDNAATTYPKPECVYAFMDSFYRNSGGNAGRGKYAMAATAGELIKDTRLRIQKLLHCPAKHVIFTPTATISLNMIIQGLIADGVRNVYISPFEHNAVTRTLHFFREKGDVVITELSVTEKLEFDLEKIKYQFDSIKPELVVMSHASNVTGLIAPVEEIFSLAKEYNSLTVIDMAQTAGLVDCNIGQDIFDFAVFAGHKTLYGPTGLSGFVMKNGINLQPILFGGTGFDSANQNMPDSIPEKYEMGTLNIAGVAGLNAALKWIEDKSIDQLYEQEYSNRKKLLNLLAEYDFIQIIGNHSEQKYVGIVSCLIEGISSDSAGSIFDQCGISVRTGLQCAPLVHRFLDTFPAGTIRFSTSYFTSDTDFEELRDALDYIEENL